MFDRFIRCSFLVFALSASTACSSTPATTSTGDASAGSTPNGATPISSAGTKDGATIVAGARSERSEAPILDSSAVIVVSGLACPKCASNVDVQLAKIPGVKVRNVDMRFGLVSVDFAAQPHPSAAQLAKAVDDAGLTFVGLGRAPAAGATQ